MKRLIKFVSLMLSVLILASSCEEEKEVHPKIETLTVTPTSFNTCNLKGSITRKGSSKVLDYGFVYFIPGYNSTESGTKISLGKDPEAGPFEIDATLIYPQYNGGTVAVRAYLTNEKGTVYGNIQEFTLLELMFTGVSPLQSKGGEKITITGTNLSTNKLDYEVKFNDTKAIVSEAYSDRIVVIVPSDIVYSYYYYNSIRISIVVGGAYYTITENFRIIPTATNFSPQSGSFGTQILISGSNFRSNNAQLKLGNRTYSPTVVDNNTLSINVPNDITDEKFKIVVFGDSFSYELPGEFVMIAPTITSFSPTSGIKGTTVTIQGGNFNASYYSLINKVTIGSIEVTAQASSNNTLSFTIPQELSLGSYPITVFNGIHSVTSLTSFEVVSPKITNFEPKSGGVGTLVTITGTNLQSNYYNSDILFGSTRAWAEEWTDTKVSVRVPSGMSAGEMKINLHIAGEIFETSENFKLLGPKVSNFSPSSGTPGTRVVLNGEGFSPTKELNKVKFGTVETTIVSATSTSLEVLVPSVPAPGGMKISVTVDKITSTSQDNFTITN